jgi:hypothetical protein
MMEHLLGTEGPPVTCRSFATIEGNTTVRRVFRGAAIGAVLAVGTIGASIVTVTPAFADGGTPTSVTVTPFSSSVVSGKPNTFTAVITPTKVGAEKISGSVTWTVTGATGTVVPCSTINPLSTRGTSRCKIDKDILLAGSAPFTVTASYSGSTSGTFAPGTGSTTLAMNPATSHVKVSLDATPAGNTATTATATVVGGPATSQLGGTVIFTVTSPFHANGVAVRCTGTASPATANNVKTLVDQTATCTLPAGWVVIPKPSTANKRPSDPWSISAVYNGNASFTPSYVTKKGIARS